MGLLQDFTTQDDVQFLKRLLKPNHYLTQLQDNQYSWAKAWRTAFQVTDSGLITWRGYDIDTFHMALNTALAIGNDQLYLMTRMAAQAEIHGFLEPEDCRWAADVIDQGLALGVYRHGVGHVPTGWLDVIALLRKTEDPVVLSYNVCDSFPNVDIAYWGTNLHVTEEMMEKFDNLSVERQWKICMANLREMHNFSLRITRTPERKFGHGLSVFDFIAEDQGSRFDAAYERGDLAYGRIN